MMTVETFTTTELRVLKSLNTPAKIQDFLDALPQNHEPDGDSCFSPRLVLRHCVAHCMEGAMLAAVALRLAGHRPLILDLTSANDDQDHVVALFRRHGHWGAISKTNHAVLRYREPVYRTIRELAMSYFHEYFMDDGLKSLRRYSKPFDLSKYAPERWITAEEDLFWLIEPLDSSPHFPLVPKKNERLLRHATKAELDATDYVEWKKKTP